MDIQKQWGTFTAVLKQTVSWLQSSLPKLIQILTAAKADSFVSKANHSNEHIREGLKFTRCSLRHWYPLARTSYFLMQPYLDNDILSLVVQHGLKK